MGTVLITGASKGIGKSAAMKFASAGWDLLLIARSSQKLSLLSDELRKTGSKVFFKSIDFSDSSQITNGIDELLSHGIIPSVVINNAGVAWTGELSSMPLAKWQWLLQINLTSVFQVTSSLVPIMRKQGGLFINVSSHAARNSFPQWGAYCISKSALERFTKCLAEEERKFGIRACTLTLGAVNSDLWDSENVQSDFDRGAMLSVDQAASELLYLANKPNSQVIEDITLMPSAGAF